MDSGTTVKETKATTLRTLRMVAEFPMGDRPVGESLVCIDVVLRGTTEHVAEVESRVKAFLDIGIELPGGWVDNGTTHINEDVTFSVGA